MKKFIINIFLTFYSIVSAFSTEENSSNDLGTVVFANILFRHGDRTPVEPYPNDPHRNESEWPVPYGQLTTTGMHQHLLLGQWLRSRYDKLIPDHYSLDDIYVRSTDVDRTLMSAESNLAGLYPPKGNQRWDNMRWMPIPVHTIPETMDYVLAGKKKCRRYDDETQKLLSSELFVKINRQNSKLYDYLSRHAGKKINSVTEVEYFYNTLCIEELYNKTLPDWTKAVYPDKLRPIAEFSFKVQAYNKILQRLKIGSLLGEMIDHMVAKSENKLSPNRKLWIYSGHDETVANLLMALDLFYPHCPPYTATILIELRTNLANEFFVTVSYKNTSGEPSLLTVPGCKPLCPLEDFIRLTEDVIPNDFERECLSDSTDNQNISIDNQNNCYNNDDDNSNSINFSMILGVLISTIIMIIMMIVLILFFYWHYKQNLSR
ncbi:Similar to acp2: Lysosomal acid phosphatase (Xenopus laevis) [Cotesia congregata]|uniref:acid phosphatase n=1 Tax=Cotesia congregata TaxID=51543 RepID=A0A8J2HE93_COTCN|nr:Similar to acp2: Lysosomal acid phosphatase (Xenopus laevis) [Cotesia congregata]